MKQAKHHIPTKKNGKKMGAKLCEEKFKPLMTTC
jgi:hypothetical protein